MTRSHINADDITMVVLAAGVGDRMGVDLPKQFVPLGDSDDPQRTPLDLVLESYEGADEVGQLLVVCSDEHRELTENITSNYAKTMRIIEGGETRHASLYRGIEAVETPIAGIHDAARPLLYRPALDAAIERLRDGFRAVTTVLHTYASMVECTENGPSSRVLERSNIAHLIAPAFYYADDLLAALRLAEEQGLEFRDEPAMIFELLPDTAIATVEGHRSGFKLTYGEDFEILAAYRRHLTTPER